MAGTMLCRRCNTTAPAARPPNSGALRAGMAAGVLCSRCGTVLGPYDLTAQLVAKFAQLSRFGLAGRDELLRPPADPNEDS
jgi:hypothetical protein